MHRLIPIAASLAISSATAHAQTSPLVQPSRDVTVRYAVSGDVTSLLPGGLPGPVTLSWSAERQRVRADAEGRNQVAVLDLRAGTGQVYDTSLKVVLPLKLRHGVLGPLTPEPGRLQARGRQTVAGLTCTEYAVAGRDPGTICLTADGVPLRGDGRIDGRQGRFTALSVTYGAIPPDRFAPPPGYLSLGDTGRFDVRSLLGTGAAR